MEASAKNSSKSNKFLQREVNLSIEHSIVQDKDGQYNNMEIYKWKWMVLGALWYIINANYGKKGNDNIVVGVFFICKKLRHVQVIEKYRTRTHRPLN